VLADGDEVTAVVVVAGSEAALVVLLLDGVEFVPELDPVC
jgi:hypothetical protein